MQSSVPRVFSLLGTTVVLMLILCHVVGAFCPMTVPTAEAATTIQGPPVGHGMHGMSEGLQCQDSLTSVAKESGAKVAQAYAVPEGNSAGDSGSLLTVEHLAWSPHAPKIPLYTLLSTFLI